MVNNLEHIPGEWTTCYDGETFCEDCEYAFKQENREGSWWWHSQPVGGFDYTDREAEIAESIQ